MLTIGHTTATTVEDNQNDASEIDTVLIKVASRCNINCSYCYVYHMGDDNWSKQSKFMQEETIDAMCLRLQEIIKAQGCPFSVVLHGGEPFLLGPARLENLLAKLRRILPLTFPISIQTNGALITNKILDICSTYQASVAVSIDGPSHIHNRFRIGHDGEGTFEMVMKGFGLLREHPDHVFLNAGLLAVIDPESQPGEVYHFFKQLGAPSVDFLYKDGNFERLPSGKAEITSVEYGQWMTGLLDVYLADAKPMPIRIIDDMLKVLLGGIVSKEGLGVTDFGIIIIDTDGTVMKNDTLKSTYNGADKFSSPVNVKDGNIMPFLESQAFMEYRKLQQPKHPQCIACPHLNVCGGGMILHRWSSESGFENPSVYCSDQIYLINYMSNKLKALLSHAN